MKDQKVLLLFGMPRSGTTWVGKIIDSNPDTLYLHEPDSWNRLDRIPLFVESMDVEYGDELKHFVESLPLMRKAQVTSKLPIFKKNYQSSLRHSAYKGSLYATKLAGKIGFTANPISRISRNKNQFYIAWKSIESLGRLSLFSQLIEGSQCLHIVRNPAGYISSVLSGESKNSFQSSTPSSDDFQIFEMLLNTACGKDIGIGLDELKMLDPVERLAIRWRLYNEIAFAGCKDLHNYHRLIYEDLCRNPLDIAKRVINELGLQWSTQTEAFVKLSTSQDKKAYYSVYKNPLEAAYKWQTKLSATDIDKIKNILRGSVAFSWYEADF
ncbi:MAG: sulfotransferase [Gammaproteobacteria bacterium]|nr:sulfotransferase [Gammaproteobacteria bacterium]